MKRTVLLIFLLIITAIISFQIQSFEFVLLALIILSLIFIILAGVKNYFKKVKIIYFKIPGFIILFCLFGVFTALLRPYERAILESGTVSERLKYAHSTDQNDRKQLRSYIKGLSKIENRDRERLSQVKDLYQQNKIIKPIDKFYAAFVYHHSDNSADYKIASELSSAAAAAEELSDNYQVQWLAQASYDRWMLSLGKDEKYDTQNNFSIDF